MLQQSIILRPDRVACSKSLVESNTSLSPWLVQIVRDSIKTMYGPKRSLDPQSRQNHPQDQQKPISTSPYLDTIPEIHKDGITTASHTSSVESAESLYESDTDSDPWSGQPEAVRMPEMAHLAPIKHNISTGLYEFSFTPYQAHSDRYFDPCQPHIPPIPKDVSVEDEVAAIIHEQKETEELVRKRHELENLVNINAAEQEVTPLTEEACNKIISSEPDDEIQERAHDLPVANPTDITKAIQTAVLPTKKAIKKALLAASKKYQDKTIPHLTAGTHWFTGEVRIEPHEVALERSYLLEMMPRVVDRTHYHIFWTDGSLKQGGKKSHPGGSAAVWKSEGNSTKWQVVSNRTPYDTRDCTEPELYGIQLAMEEAIIQISESRRLYPQNTCDEVFLLTDSQASLRYLMYTKINTPTPVILSPNHYVAHIIRCCDILREMGVPVVLRWVPGHSCDNGNELADRYAKMAAKKHPEEERPPNNAAESTRTPPGSHIWRMKDHIPIPPPGISPNVTIPWPCGLKVTTMNVEKRIYSISALSDVGSVF